MYIGGLYLYRGESMGKDVSDVSLEPENKLNKNGDRRGLHPNSRKNLKPNGNPGGRPKKDICITSRQKEMLSEKCPFDSQGRTWRDSLAEAGMRMALLKPEAMRDFMDRHWGKVSQPISGDEENPIFVQLLSRLRGYGNKDKD